MTRKVALVVVQGWFGRSCDAGEELAAFNELIIGHASCG
jgi:hypothetical protein